MFVVAHVLHTPQHACAAGVTSGTRLRTGSAWVFARSSIVPTSLAPAQALRPPAAPRTRGAGRRLDSSCRLPGLERLAPDRVVDFHDLRRSGIDPDISEERHETLSERLPLLFRIPDLTDAEVPVRHE